MAKLNFQIERLQPEIPPLQFDPWKRDSSLSPCLIIHRAITQNFTLSSEGEFEISLWLHKKY